MYPAAFDYFAPDTIDEALSLLVEHGPDAKVLAGGCSLIPLLKLRMAAPGVLIDVRRAIGASIDATEEGIVIGAMTREAAIESDPTIVERYPILAETSAVIADPIVRNMGTVGGNLAHADPANDHPATMLALGAEVVALGPAGERIIPIDDFFVDLYATALAPDELLTAIRVPQQPPASGGVYVKFERQIGDFPIVGVAAHLTLEGDVIRAVRIGLTNVAPTAVRARTAEAALIDQAATPATIEAAAAATADGIAPWGELRGSADYKLAILPELARRALDAALDRARLAAGAA
jgi:carbon-monoxide dehydrogenase medium subunit